MPTPAVTAEFEKMHDQARAAHRWTYAQITAAAELEIGRAAALARCADSQGDYVMHRSIALGVFSLWQGLTVAWVKPGDTSRLHKLTQVTGGPF